MLRTKPISPTLHGVVDYVSVAGLLVMSRTLRLPASLRRLLQISACFSLLYSLLTRYRLGLVKVLPMEGHLALDLTSAASLFTAPETLGVRDPRSRLLLRGLGVFETVVPLLTRTQGASTSSGTDTRGLSGYTPRAAGWTRWVPRGRKG